MLLRQIYLVKKRVLATQRQELLATMQHQGGALDITAAFPDSTTAAVEQPLLVSMLKRNAADQQQLVHRMSRALLAGVCSLCMAAGLACAVDFMLASLNPFCTLHVACMFHHIATQGCT